MTFVLTDMDIFQMTAVFSISMVLLLRLTLSQKSTPNYENNLLLISNNETIFTLQDEIIKVYYNITNVKPPPIFHEKPCKPCEPIYYCECDNWCTLDRIVGTNLHRCNDKGKGIIQLYESMSDTGLKAIRYVGSHVSNIVSKVRNITPL